MHHTDRAIHFIRQFTLSLASWQQAWIFVKEQKPWKSLKEYGWVAKLVTIGAIFIGFHFFSSLWDWFSNLGNSDQPLGLTSTMSSFYNNVALENFQWILNGGSKYLILILLEVLVFHFARFTLTFLTGKEQDSSFDAFVNAEIRMIHVAARCWLLETVVIFLLGIALNIIGFSSWKPFFAFFIQCYFVGYAILDNYFECFGATVKESAAKILEVAGAAVGIGIVAFGLMYVPIVGVVLATTIGAVAGTITLHKLIPPDQLQFEAQIV